MQVTERTVARREPIPTSRAILWKPLPDSYHLLASMMRTPEQQTHLFITQRTFLQVERHLCSAPDLDLGGFLAGHLYDCPRTRVRYSIVTTTVPFADVTGDPLGRRVTEREYTAVRRRLDAHGLVLIGWYRSGAGLGLQLLPDDIETHLAYFSEPWQTTMVVLPDPARPRGAFFTYDPRVGRGYCIPFHELFDSDSTGGQRLARSCVTWKSYVASVPVEPMPAEDREVAETTFKPIRSEPDPTPPDPIDEWWDAIKDPWVRLKDAAASARGSDQDIETAPMDWEPNESTPAVPPLEVPLKAPPTREARGPEEPVARTPAPPAVAPAASAKSASRPAPPFAGPARPPQPQSPPVRPTVRPVDAPATSSGEAAAGVNATRAPSARPAPKPPRPIPAAKAAAMAKGSLPLLVTGPPEFDEAAMRWQRRRRIGFTVAALSFLGVIVLSTIRARTQQAAQAGTTAVVDTTIASDESGMAESAPAGTNGFTAEVIPVVPFPAAVDSLSAAVAHYRSVESDHRRGRVGCRALQRAHDRAVHANARVRISRDALRGELGAVDSLRVSMTRAEYTHITQMHRRTGCQG